MVVCDVVNSVLNVVVVSRDAASDVTYEVVQAVVVDWLVVQTVFVDLLVPHTVVVSLFVAQTVAVSFEVL